MTIFLAILVSITFIFDFGMNMREAFTKKKRRLYFVVSNLVWYSVSIFLLYMSVVYSELRIWQWPYSLLIIIPIFTYFTVHLFNGVVIYNCQEEPVIENLQHNNF